MPGRTLQKTSKKSLREPRAVGRVRVGARRGDLEGDEVVKSNLMKSS